MSGHFTPSTKQNPKLKMYLHYQLEHSKTMIAGKKTFGNFLPLLREKVFKTPWPTIKWYHWSTSVWYFSICIKKETQKQACFSVCWELMVVQHGCFWNIQLGIHVFNSAEFHFLLFLYLFYFANFRSIFIDCPFSFSVVVLFCIDLV